MDRKMRLAFVCSLVMVALSIATAFAQAVAPPTPIQRWKSIAASGIELEYQPGDEALARQLLPALVQSVREVKGADAVSAEMKQVAANKTRYLRYIATTLGLPEPGKAMTRAYSTFQHVPRSFSTMLAGLHRFRLWNKDTLQTALLNGEHIPGITMNSERNGASVNFNSIAVSSGKTTSPSQRKSIQFPVLFDTNDSIEDVVENAKTFLGIFAQMTQKMGEPVILFHEVAESGVVWDFGITSAYRRWFCDGVAQFVAEQTVKEFFGQAVYEHAAMFYDPNSYLTLNMQVDLLAWRAKEYEAMRDTPRDTLEYAYYFFALQEIRGLAERHGIGVIAKVLHQLATTPAKQRDSRAILEAINAVTGEDMASRLSTYGKEAELDFRGVAIRDIQYSITGDTRAKSRKLTAGTPVILDGKHDIRVEFQYGILDHPAQIQLVLGNEQWKHTSEITLDGKDAPNASANLDLPKYLSDIKPGAYTLRLMLGDKALVEDMPVTIVAPTAR